MRLGLGLKRGRRGNAFTGLTLPALSGGSTPSAIALPYAYLEGVNLASGTFGNGAGDGIDYAYPDKEHIDFFAALGFRIIRVGFLESNVFTRNGSSLTFRNNASLGMTDINTLERVVAYAETKNMVVQIEMHNYGQNNDGNIGVDTAATNRFVLGWRMLATRFKAYPNVVFGLNNEPAFQTAAQWLSAVNLAISHIRDVGAGQAIFVMGVAFGHARSWVSGGNAAVMIGVTDPSSNFVFECHEYFDSDFSGSHYLDSELNAATGQVAVKEFVDWCVSNGKKGFIGEWGNTGTTAYNVKAQSMVDYLVAHKDSGSGGMVGHTAWAAGANWPNSYPYLVEPRPFSSGSTPANLTFLTTNLSSTSPVTFSGGNPRGPELIANGSFDTDLSGVTFTNNASYTTTRVNNKLHIARASATDIVGTPKVVVTGLTIGKTYRWAFNKSGGYAGAFAITGITGNCGPLTDGMYVREFVATATSHEIQWWPYGDNTSIDIKDVSLTADVTTLFSDDFSSGLSKWTYTNGGMYDTTLSSGAMVITRHSATNINDAPKAALTTVPGTLYTVQYDFSSGAQGGGQVSSNFATPGGDIQVAGPVGPGTGTLTFTFTATGVTSVLSYLPWADGTNITIDNVLVTY